MLRAPLLGCILPNAALLKRWYFTTSGRFYILVDPLGTSLCRQTRSRDTNIHLTSRSIGTVSLTKEDSEVVIPVDQPNIILEKLPFSAGRPWRPLPLKPLFEGRFRRGSNRYTVDVSYTDLPPYRNSRKSGRNGLFLSDVEYDPAIDRDTLYYRLLHVIATTQFVEDAWIAYSSLLALNRPSDLPANLPKIPFEHLHRLCRLISRVYPKTRKQFLRLLSVVYTVYRTGGEVKLFEWNSLIDSAGKGWRKTTVDDFKFALRIFDDMISSRPPGYSYAPAEYPKTRFPPVSPSPDIYTYTSLINIASETFYPRAVAHANSLFEASKIPPNRITHLSLLKFFAERRQMAGVRAILRTLREQDFDLGIDGLNLLLWAYSINHRLDVVFKLYRVLRHNLEPETSTGSDDVDSVVEWLREEVGIPLPTPVIFRPNGITFTMMTQIMAYHGYFKEMVSVFIDMLSTENREQGAPLTPALETGELLPLLYSPNMDIYRAIFLGFSRHGVPVPANETLSSRLGTTQAWTLAELEPIYQQFMKLRHVSKPSKSTLYWIMVAFDRTSGHDVVLLRKIWKELEKRFGGPWGGTGNRLRFLKTKLFSPDDEARLYFAKHGFRRYTPTQFH